MRVWDMATEQCMVPSSFSSVQLKCIHCPWCRKTEYCWGSRGWSSMPPVQRSVYRIWIKRQYYKGKPSQSSWSKSLLNVLPFCRIITAVGSTIVGVHPHATRAYPRGLWPPLWFSKSSSLQWLLGSHDKAVGSTQARAHSCIYWTHRFLPPSRLLTRP